MRTSKTDSLRLRVIQEVMGLDDLQLQELHEALSMLPQKKNTTLYNLLQLSADELQENMPVYTTDEVMNDMDDEMAWK